MVCQGPKRLGMPRHLQPCSAIYSNAFSSCRLSTFTLPRWRGRLGAIRRYCASVISMQRSIAQNYELVLTRPSAANEETMTRNRLNNCNCRLRIAGLATLALALLSSVAAQQAQIKLDPAKTRIEWTLGDVLHTVQGTFQLKSGTILSDPRTGEAGGQLIVDAASGNSGNKTRDSKMNKEVLESARYPEIIFVPKRVSGFVAGQESSTVQVAGSFMIHGGTHELTLSIPISVKNAT